MAVQVSLCSPLARRAVLLVERLKAAVAVRSLMLAVSPVERPAEVAANSKLLLRWNPLAIPYDGKPSISEFGGWFSRYNLDCCSRLRRCRLRLFLQHLRRAQIGQNLYAVRAQ